VILLYLHGRKRRLVLAGMGLPAIRSGVQQLASQSDIGEQFLLAADELNTLINECKTQKQPNRSLNQLQQVRTAHQL
ncbi:flagellar protein FlgN, partial [Pseudomonas syringae pv. tagetis]